MPLFLCEFDIIRPYAFRRQVILGIFVKREREAGRIVTNAHKFEEVTLSTKSIYQGKIINVEVQEVKLPNGETSKREIVRHPGAVAVIAIRDGKMLVVDQYRKPLGRCEVEIPAGKLDPGEDPLDAAKRELEEETGYKAENLKLVHSFYTSPGFADELIHLYFTDQLTKGTLQLDEDEFLENDAITLEEAKAYIAEQRISDAKTILAVYVWEQHIQRGQL
ncbi:ADP-ribose pyrophosphatase [Paenibacillus larvae subsp. pulvifaciens]|nr:ADP-ribose pyrophosphatase [Paenibacillus larvae subsp. pulvifaciens]